MDRFKENPEPFLRRSSTLKTANDSDQFRNYRAKTGHDARFGKARLHAKISDLATNVEIGETEDTKSPLVVMSARGDKRFTHDTKSNEVDMNRAYKRRFAQRTHHYDIDQESVLPEVDSKESGFKYKRHMKRITKSDKDNTEAFDIPMPFMNDENNKEAIMNLNERLMENRADATMHRGREPTGASNQSEEHGETKKELESRRDHHRKIEHLKQEKQKMYFKQFSRVWDDLKRSGKKKDTLFPEGPEPTEEEAVTESSDSMSTEASSDGAEGVNTYDSG